MHFIATGRALVLGACATGAPGCAAPPTPFEPGEGSASGSAIGREVDTCGEPVSLAQELADQVADWLVASAIRDGDGVAWYPHAEWQGGAELSLYSGTPGVVLFFIEHHALTGALRSRMIAVEALDGLMARAHVTETGTTWLRDGSGRGDAGLYTGTAGVGALFLNAWLRFGDERYRDHARGAAQWLCRSVEERTVGASWNPSDDIISGAAGTTLFLIRAAEELEQPNYLRVAESAGDALLESALVTPHGLKWGATRGAARHYPNFSHGTSGIAYCLAALYRATGEDRYLRAALSGAEWLAAKDTGGNLGSSWFHHEPGGEDLHYVGWCHGPAGTARLFRELYLATGDAQWLEREEQCARWLMASGFMDQAWDGFWNVSACCGSAGIGDFFADLFRHTGNTEYMAWAQHMVRDLAGRSRPGQPGVKWIQAEHRVRPDLLQAQTGWAQGAGGIGLFLLKVQGLGSQESRYVPLSLPDSPY